VSIELITVKMIPVAIFSRSSCNDWLLHCHWTSVWGK